MAFIRERADGKIRLFTLATSSHLYKSPEMNIELSLLMISLFYLSESSCIVVEWVGWVGVEYSDSPLPTQAGVHLLALNLENVTFGLQFLFVHLDLSA